MLLMKSNQMPNRFSILITLFALSGLSACGRAPSPADKHAQAVLPVETIPPVARDAAITIDTAGVLAPWQEVAIGPEVSGYRISEILVDVGSVVTKGQVLARLDETLLSAEVDQRKAALNE